MTLEMIREALKSGTYVADPHRIAAAMLSRAITASITPAAKPRRHKA